jgi:hypothetical protein
MWFRTASTAIRHATQYTNSKEAGAFPQPAAKAAGRLPEGSAAEAEKHIFSPCTLTFLKSFKFCPAGAKGGCNPPSVLIR